MKSSVETSAEISEEEIRPKEIFDEFMALSAIDAEEFFDRDQLVTVDCPACGGNQYQAGFTKHSFQYVQCNDCNSLYASPRPNSAELLRYYASSESQKFWCDTILARTGEKRKASILFPNVRRIEGYLEGSENRNPGRVLDVGCASGAFLLEWKKRHEDAEICGIEPGEEAAENCRREGIEVFEGFIEDQCEQPGAIGDLVTCFEVLEHVFEPEIFARALCKVTAPGGTAIVTCLGADGFDIQVLWENSRSVMPPFHLNFLSVKGMVELFSGAGFDHVEIHTPGRLDVEIVQRALSRDSSVIPSRFEKLLLAKGKETIDAFQCFLAEHGLSSHVWILCHRNS